VEIPVPLGDVVDKITILRIKVARLEAPEARGAAARELEELESRWAAAGHPDVPEFEELEAINGQLWEVEDQLRRHEADADFGPRFVARARAVYLLNDRRAALKARVNARMGSFLVEQKQYVDY
jgi:hypothetical protein